MFNSAYSHKCYLFFYKENGFLHEWTCVEIPQQNGLVERKRRHLFDVARSLRFHAYLPPAFWGECLLIVAYLINYIPNPNLDGKFPHELLFKKTPSYDNLYVFGCLCYAHTLQMIVTNFPHVRLDVFLLVILLANGDIKFMILIPKEFSHPKMSLLLKIFFLSIPHPYP